MLKVIWDLVCIAADLFGLILTPMFYIFAFQTFFTNRPLIIGKYK